jgi:transposase
VVKALQALRGVQFVIAAVLAAEIGDFARFSNPRQRTAYAGLVSSEHSSGASRPLGGITHAGNRHARWILVEAV